MRMLAQVFRRGGHHSACWAVAGGASTSPGVSGPRTAGSPADSVVAALTSRPFLSWLLGSAGRNSGRNSPACIDELSALLTVTQMPPAGLLLAAHTPAETEAAAARSTRGNGPAVASPRTVGHVHPDGETARKPCGDGTEDIEPASGPPAALATDPVTGAPATRARTSQGAPHSPWIEFGRRPASSVLCQHLVTTHGIFPWIETHAAALLHGPGRLVATPLGCGPADATGDEWAQPDHYGASRGKGQLPRLSVKMLARSARAPRPFVGYARLSHCHTTAGDAPDGPPQATRRPKGKLPPDRHSDAPKEAPQALWRVSVPAASAARPGLVELTKFLVQLVEAAVLAPPCPVSLLHADSPPLPDRLQQQQEPTDCAAESVLDAAIRDLESGLSYEPASQHASGANSPLQHPSGAAAMDASRSRVSPSPTSASPGLVGSVPESGAFPPEPGNRPLAFSGGAQPGALAFGFSFAAVTAAADVSSRGAASAPQGASGAAACADRLLPLAVISSWPAVSRMARCQLFGMTANRGGLRLSLAGVDSAVSIFTQGVGAVESLANAWELLMLAGTDRAGAYDLPGPALSTDAFAAARWLLLSLWRLCWAIGDCLASAASHAPADAATDVTQGQSLFSPSTLAREPTAQLKEKRIMAMHSAAAAALDSIVALSVAATGTEGTPCTQAETFYFPPTYVAATSTPTPPPCLAASDVAATAGLLRLLCGQSHPGPHPSIKAPSRLLLLHLLSVVGAAAPAYLKHAAQILKSESS
eukprot:GHVT01100679.1.p1 GENE.GHVT01100679.1~~GHVT01100679.1.p1  ORF type:complete len:761 (-),score=166.48 GHVT01100679.1:203-2485(-)